MTGRDHRRRVFAATLGAELRRHRRRPSIVIVGLVLGLIAWQTLSYIGPGAKGVVSVGPVAHDAPWVLALLFGRLAVIAVLLIAVVAGEAGQRDVAGGWREFLAASAAPTGPIVLARWAAATLAVVSIFTIPIVTGAMGLAGLPAEFLGESPATAGILAALAASLPSLLIASALLFSIASIGRSMAPVYVATIALVALHLAANAAAVRGGGLLVAADPFGLAPIRYATNFWSVVERSNDPVPFTGVWLAGRIVWTATAAFALVAAARLLGKPARRRRFALPTIQLPAPRIFRPTHAFSERLRYETGRLLRHPAFLAITGLALVQVYRNLLGATAFDGRGSLPLSSVLVSAAVNVNEFVLGMTFFFSGWLVWRERRHGSSDIVSTTPVSGLSVVAAKLGSIMVAQAVLAGSAVGLAILFQLSRGVSPALDPYLSVVGLAELPGYFHWALLAVLAQVVAPNRYAGYLAAAATIAVSSLGLQMLGVKSPLFLYGQVPAYVYSMMNGLGHFVAPILALRAYWLLLSVPLVYVVVRAWERRRVADRSPRFARVSIACTGLGAIAALMISAEETTPGMTSLDITALRGAYERQYGFLRDADQPELVGVDLNIGFWPAGRRVTIEGKYTLANETQASINSVYLLHLPVEHTRLLDVRLDRDSRTQDLDEDLGQRTLELAEPLLPGDTLRLQFTVEVEEPVVWASQAGNWVAPSGSYLDNFIPGRLFPAVGYQPMIELEDPAARREQGLPARSLPAADAGRSGRRALMPPIVRFEATVSTSEDQIPLAPGERVATWVEDGRNYARFSADSIRASMAFISGVYEVVTAQSGPTTIEVYHHRGHGTNVQTMLDGTIGALEESRAFGPYPYPTYRIVEVPDYGHIRGTARAYPTFTVWNETGGWFHDYSNSAAFPFAFATAAHETAHQWWPTQVNPALAEGAGLIGEGLPDHIRVKVIEAKFGRAGLTRWMADQNHLYFQGRAAVVDEHPLIRAIHGFEYRSKAQFALRWLDVHDPSGLHDAIEQFTDAHRWDQGVPPTSLDLRAALEAGVADSLAPQIDEWFNQMIFWDNSLHRARASRVGVEWEVTVDAEINRLMTDDAGRTVPAPSSPVGNPVELGFYDKEGREIALVQREFLAGNSTVHVILDERPNLVRLDPRMLLLERTPGDESAPVPPDSR